ncbi:branched-chain amino acid ABC transporter permease [Actinomadura sp. 9N407]|uniref:branched-chain amino acid ABC transporter permease n=1 Tax=Actinomadura sp. 9N407 TaxID=3375154 RepID=UPI00379EE810
MSERRIRRPAAAGSLAVLGLVLLVLPLYLQAFWLQVGLIAMASMVGALGLNLLVGVTGQLSLAHAFFLAVGAYGYAFLSGGSSTVGGVTVSGLGLPTPLAAILAVAAAGLAGVLFAPIAGRLRGIYLGLASLSLVFLGQHLLFNVTPVTGGFSGRAVPDLEVLGFSFNPDQPTLSVFGVPLGAAERLWYLALAVLAFGCAFVWNVTRTRPGRALLMVRDNEIAAGCLGIPVRQYKAAAFAVSSMLAGAAGVLLALAFRRVVPEYFGLLLSIDFLAMIVIGGLGSVTGAALGAAFVSALPLALAHYSEHLPFLAAPGSEGVAPGVAARLIFGAMVVAILLAEPKGAVALARRVGGLVGRRPTDPSDTDSNDPSTAAEIPADLVQGRSARHA